MADRVDYGRTRGRDYGEVDPGRYGSRGPDDWPYSRRRDWESGFQDRPLTRRFDPGHDLYDEDYYTEPTFTYSETWWWVPGPFTGTGPQGYRRSDDRIREDVNDRLMQHGNIDAHDIQVVVDSSEVTLRGFVPDRRTKRLAEDVAESVMGVTDIHNELRIRDRTRTGPGPQGTRLAQGEGMQHGPAPRREQLRPGMTVLGLDGDQLGQIKEIRESDFLLDRPLARDVFVPFNAVHIMDGDVMLNIPTDQIDNQNWPSPEVTGRQTTTRR